MKNPVASYIGNLKHLDILLYMLRLIIVCECFKYTTFTKGQIKCLVEMKIVKLPCDRGAGKHDRLCDV